MSLKPAAGTGPPPTPRPQIVEPACAVFRRRLRESGLKYTPERAQVLDIISSLQGPFHAEQVIEALAAAADAPAPPAPPAPEVDGPRPRAVRVSKATVYRTIHLLVESGVLRPVRLDADIEHYELEWGDSGTVVVVHGGQAQSVEPGPAELAAAVEAQCQRMGIRSAGYRLVIYARPDAPLAPTTSRA